MNKDEVDMTSAIDKVQPSFITTVLDTNTVYIHEHLQLGTHAAFYDQFGGTIRTYIVLCQVANVELRIIDPIAKVRVQYKMRYNFAYACI